MAIQCDYDRCIHSVDGKCTTVPELKLSGIAEYWGCESLCVKKLESDD